MKQDTSASFAADNFQKAMLWAVTSPNAIQKHQQKSQPRTKRLFLGKTLCASS